MAFCGRGEILELGGRKLPERFLLIPLAELVAFTGSRVDFDAAG